LAITLLNNANLEEGTLTNAKLQLISLAEARSRNEKNSESISISKESLEVLSKISAEFQDALEAPATSRGDLGRRFLLDFRSDCLPLIAKMTETLRHINQEHQAGTKDDVSGLVLSKQNRCKLHLEDAVSVLGNLTLTSGGPSATFSMKEVETLIDRNVQKALLSVSQNVAHPSSAGFRSSKEQKGKSRPGKAQNFRGNAKRKTSALDLDDNTCFDCGVTGHKRGDAECKQPSYFTKKLKARKGGKTSEKAEKGQEGSFFRRGSSAGQRN